MTSSTLFAPIYPLCEHESIISNGPFRVQKWQQRNFLLVEKNPTYWDREHVFLDSIRLQVIPDPVSQFYLYEHGELDYIGEPLSTLSIDVLRENHLAKEVQQCPSSTISWIFINTEIFPFTHIKFRKALALALDRKALAEHVLQMGETPAFRLLGAHLSLGLDPYFCDSDEETARCYLEEALADLEISIEDLPPIVLSHRMTPWVTRLMQALQHQWQEKLSIRVELEVSDWATHFGKVAQGDYQLAEMRWISWFDDPIHLLGSFGDNALRINVSHWESASYRSYLSFAGRAHDPLERNKWLLRAEKHLLDEMPVIPLYFAQISYLKRSNLQGVMISPLHEIDFKGAYFASK